MFCASLPSLIRERRVTCISTARSNQKLLSNLMIFDKFFKTSIFFVSIFQNGGVRTFMDSHIDSLDLRILSELIKDARKPLLEISRALKVAHGTVNARLAKLKRAGVVRGAHLDVDFTKLGFTLTALIGIKVQQAGQHKDVIASLKKFPDVVEAHYTTGTYSLLIKVVARDIGGLHTFLSERLQTIPGIHSTETFMVLDSPIERNFTPSLKLP